MSLTELLISLGALILLSGIAFWLWRTARLRALTAILLVILPFALGNGLWFGYLQKKVMIARLQHELKTVPVYLTLKKQLPALYQQIEENIEQDIQEGVPLQSTIDSLKSVIAELVAKRVMSTPDKEILDYARVIIDELKYLQKNNSEDCFKALFPQVEGGIDPSRALSPSLNKRELEALNAILLASDRPSSPFDFDGSKARLEALLDELYPDYGDDILMIARPDDPEVDKSKVCAITISLYDRVMALPPHEAADLMRLTMWSGQ